MCFLSYSPSSSHTAIHLLFSTCLFSFHTSAILLSSYAISSKYYIPAPTKIILGHDNNKIQGSLYSEDGSFILKSLNREINARAKTLGWLREGDSWRSDEWCGGPGPSRGPSVIPWEIGSLLTSHYNNILLLQNNVWWPCPCSYEYPPHPIVLGHFSFTIKTLLKSPMDLPQGNSVDASSTHPAGFHSVRRAWKSVSSQEFFLPRGGHIQKSTLGRKKQTCLPLPMITW